MLTITSIFLIIAFVAFLLATFSIPTGRISTIGLGLLCSLIALTPVLGLFK